MLRGKTTIFLAMAVTALIFAGVAISQDGLGRTGGDAGGTASTEHVVITPKVETDPERIKEIEALMEQNRKQASEAARNEIGATNEEWSVLEAKVMKIKELQIQETVGIRTISVNGAAMPTDDQDTDLLKATAALCKLLANKDSKPEDIKAALESYRRAKAKAKEDLVKARKELKELLTVKQEAKLVLKGLLE